MGESDPGFGDRPMSGLDLKLEPKPAEGRRIEAITGGRRRRWSDDEKARAVEASLAPGAVVSAVARLHGKRCSQATTICASKRALELAAFNPPNAPPRMRRPSRRPRTEA
jgi:transposase